MSQLTEAILTIATAIIGVAILAVLVSRNSNTSGVLASFGQMFANMLSAATGPVTGKAATPNVGGGMGGLPSFNLPQMSMPQVY